jgi:hypothetical protein
MTRLRLRALRRAFGTRHAATPPVHFHSGPQGKPAACFDEACRNPRLDVG